jgi:hypothetical protein
MTARAFTRAELDALATPPAAQFAAAVAGGDADQTLALFDRLERSYRNFVDGFDAFAAAIHEWTVTTHGFDALTLLLRAERTTTTIDAARRGLTEEHMHDVVSAGRWRDALRSRLDEGDRSGALAVFDRLESSMRIVHDNACVRAVAALSHVYRTWGVEGVEASIRLAGERTLLNFMPYDLARSAEERIKHWSRMMLGNFALITVDEHDDRFVITQDPCGTCTRQVIDGCYAPPVDLAVVTEKCPLTFGQGDMPVYRTHVAVMHYLQAIERGGVPWPAIECPAGVDAGPCRVTIYKDPSATPALWADRVATAK